MAFRFGDGRDFHALTDLDALGDSYLGYRHVITCAPEDAETWQLCAEARGIEVVVIAQPGLPEGTAITWQARRPRTPKSKQETA